MSYAITKFITLWIGFCLFATTAHAVGFLQIAKGDLEIGVWYPSDAEEVKGRLGPFDVKYAFDGFPLRGSWPVILFSHGNNGHYRNHHKTLETLAQAGFIVIAPQHRVDYLIGGKKTADAMKTRVGELAIALDSVKRNIAFVNIIDERDISGLGYALGSIIVLAASGGTIDSDVMEAHCKQNSNNDKGFCKGPSAIARWIKGVGQSVKLETASGKENYAPFINSLVAVVAPIGQGIVLDRELLPRRFMVVGFTDDKITPIKFHANPLYQNLLQHGSTCLQEEKAHHHAFVAHFPEWATDSNARKLNEDPQNFNRDAFLAKLNKDLTFFFLRQHQCR